jgi:hypothetical protein
MRAIEKPSAPQLQSTAYGEWATALGNAVGRFCSFCEKALTYQLLLFHKQQGVVLQNTRLNAADWSNLLLICGDCASMVTNYNPQTSYFWPDTNDALESPPYIYGRFDNIGVTVLNPEGEGVHSQSATSLILVQVSNDVSSQIQTNARNTYTLFRLNGRYFNENFQQPAHTLPYEEYVHPSDYRLDMRWDASTRAVEAGNALARAIPTFQLGSKAYTQNTLALVSTAINSFGFLSTWQAMIVATLNAINPDLLPQLIGLMTVEKDPTRPLDRKRTFVQTERGLTQASEVSAEERSRFEKRLRALINVVG